MNQVLSAIMERRSIRAYRAEPLSDDEIGQIVQAGLYAPSSRNSQPWHIAVVQKADLIRRLTDEVKAAILRGKVEKYYSQANNSGYHLSYGAPCFVIVSADPSASPCPVEDCSLALGNMFLAAHSLGIGSCWINQLGPVCDDAGVRALLNECGVPPGNRVYGASAFGRAANAQPATPARKDNNVSFVK